jgi:type IV secretion system protein VirB10
MIALMVMAALLQQGPKRLDVDESKIQPPLVVPVGTVIPISLTSRISTKTAQDGDGVYGKTVFPITIDNKIVIPEGSFVKGKITAVKQPGRVKGKAELTLTFQTLVLPSGITVPMYSSLGSVGADAKRKGEATAQGDGGKGKDAGTIATAGSEGALIGVLAGHGKGAAVGGAAGGAVGAATVLLTRGPDLVLQPGTTIEIVLDRPLEP